MSPNNYLLIFIETGKFAIASETVSNTHTDNGTDIRRTGLFVVPVCIVISYQSGDIVMIALMKR